MVKHSRLTTHALNPHTMSTKAAIYCRVSTPNQDTSSQQDACEQFAKQHDEIDTWDVYTETASGHDDTRDEYTTLKQLITRGTYDYFICTEFSRISRNDDEIKHFISQCFDEELGIEILQSAFSVDADIDEITKLAMKMVADILAGISSMEQLQKIDRIKRGLQYAREHEGKFTNRAPAGFEISDGYITVNENDFLSTRDALLDHHYNGTSFSELEEHTPVSRSALSKIYNTTDRRRLYIHGEGYDKHNLLNETLDTTGMKTYLQTLDDAPERINPEQERKQRKQWNSIGNNQKALLKTMNDIAKQHTTNPNTQLTDSELLDLYTTHRNTLNE